MPGDVRSWLGGLAILLLTVTSAANAAPVAWVVDSALSKISLAVPDQITVLNAPTTLRLRNQTGSTSAPWSQGNQGIFGGWFNTAYDEAGNLIQFDTGSNVSGINSGSFRPNYPAIDAAHPTYTTTETAPAVFGGRIRATTAQVFNDDAAQFSMTNATLGLTSAPLPITPGGSGTNQFTPTGVAAAWSSLRMHLDGFSVSLQGQPIADASYFDASGNLGTSTTGMGTISQGGVPVGFDRTMTMTMVVPGSIQFPNGPLVTQALITFTAYANVAGPGNSPDNPEVPGEPRVFTDVSSNQWFDPPATGGFDYAMLGDSLFTGITGLPTGFNAPFEVSVSGISLGSFTSSDQVVFANFADLLGPLLVNGSGVPAFRISGISPEFDSEEPIAFPTMLAFDTLTASFSMTPVPVPEPSSLVLACVALAGLGIVGRRRHGSLPHVVR